MPRSFASLSSLTQHRARQLWQDYGIIWMGAIIAGLIAVGYAKLIDYGFSLFSAMRDTLFWAPLFVTPLVGAACVWITRKFFQGAEGSGIPQVVAMLHRDASLGKTLLTPRIIIGKIGISFLAILGGFTIGREGPTVQVGAALMYQLRRFYRDSSVALERQLALAGAAAGLSAAFNTPLAGIVFAIEELARNFEQRASGVVITAIIFAGIVALGINGNYTYFGTIEVRTDFPKMLILACIAVAIVTGIAGGAFVWLILNSTRWIPKPIARMRAEQPVLFGALCGLVVAVLGLLSWGASYGSGYAEAHAALDGRQSLSLFYPFLKIASMIASYLPGIPGGIFAPSLAIGAGLGNLLHEAFSSLSIPLLIALGMVGYLSAVTQAPITAFVIVMEMINGHALVISLMVTSLLASRVSKLFAPPFYETLALRYAVTPAPSATPQTAESATAAAVHAQPASTDVSAASTGNDASQSHNVAAHATATAEGTEHAAVPHAESAHAEVPSADNVDHDVSENGHGKSGSEKPPTS